MHSVVIEKKQKKIILGILKKYFGDAKYFVFGSRATHKNLKPFSDLDIAIQGDGKLDVSTVSKALEDFSASDLPFRVDIVDLHSIKEDFRLRIEPDFIELLPDLKN